MGMRPQVGVFPTLRALACSMVRRVLDQISGIFPSDLASLPKDRGQLRLTDAKRDAQYLDALLIAFCEHLPIDETADDGPDGPGDQLAMAKAFDGATSNVLRHLVREEFRLLVG